MWCLGHWLSLIIVVEKMLEGSLDSIPSHSVKIQIMGGKVCLSCKGKTLLDIVNKLFVFKSLLTTPSNVLPLHLPTHNLNFHWMWWDQIQTIFLNLFYFTENLNLLIYFFFYRKRKNVQKNKSVLKWLPDMYTQHQLIC